MANSSSSSGSKGTGFLSSYLSTTKPTDFYTGKFNFGDAFKNVDPSPKSWDHSIDWKNYNKDTDFSSAYRSDTTDMFKGLFDKAKDTEKYRNWVSEKQDSKPQPFGIPGKAGQVLDNLAAVYPQQTVLPGSPGSPGLFGAIGGLAGGLGTALGVFGPAGAGIGAGIGGLIDAIA